MPRIAIVTGGASGIGAALCRAVDRRGGHVVVADVDLVGAQRVAAGLGSAEAIELDVRDGAGVQQVVDDAVDRHGRLDLMANNAGIGVGGDVEELDLAHWDRVIDVNLRGVVHGVAAAYPVMQAQGSGRILNTSSLSGLLPVPFLAPYAMTKHAVVGLSLSLRPEAARHGVGVTVLCPGGVDTPLLDRGGPEDLPAVASMQDVDARELLRRLAGPLYDADGLAEDAMRGLARDDALVVAPWTARAAHRAWRLAPGLLRSQLTRGIAIADELRGND